MRRIGLVAMGLAAALLITGCSASGGSGGAKPAASGNDDQLTRNPITLTYAMFAQPQKAVVQTALNAFHAQHRNITINIQLTPQAQYDTKLQTQFESGNGPDIFWAVGGELPLYAAGGVAQNLSSYIKADDYDTSGLNKAAMTAMTIGGKVYGLPHSATVPGLWYNKKLFDAAGVSYPTPDWTWQDVQTAAKRLTDASAGIYGIGATLNLQANYAPTILEAGGSFFSSNGKKSGLNSKACAEGVGFWTDMISNGYSPTLAQMTETDTSTMFEAGKLGMMFANNSAIDAYSASAVKSDIDVVPLPAGPAGKATTFTSLPIVMNSKTAHPKEVWALMKFLTSTQGLTLQAAKGGAMPPAQAALSAWQSNYPGYNTQAFADSFSFAKPYPQSKNTGKWVADVNTALNAAWSLKSSPADACSAAANAMNKDLAAE